MNCHDCEGLLQRQLDGEAVASPELDRHLAECGHCRGQFAAVQLLLTGFRRMAVPVPPPGLADQVVRQVLRDRLKRRVRLRWVAAAATLAACLLIAFWFHQNRNQEITPLPVAAAADDKPGAVKDPSLRESVGEARKALDHLASEMLDKTRKEVDVIRDVTAALEAPRIDQARSETEPKLARTRPGMTTGLQTVSAVTRRGVSFMLRETPPLQSGKKNAE